MRRLLAVEADPPHAALVARLLRGVEPAVVVDPLHVVVVDHLVERPEVDVARPEMPERRLELLHRGLVVAQVRAALPDQLHALAVAVAQRQADPALRAAVAVLGGDLQHRHALVDGLAHQPDGPLLAGRGEAAGAEAEDAEGATGASEGAMLERDGGLRHGVEVEIRG